MKELSIEEKAQAYDKAIEKFDVILNLNTVKESGTIFADDVRKIFPELKESEDEKIKKILLDFLENELEKHGNEEWDGCFHTTDMIAWLEKQGEQKPSKIHRIGVSAFTDTIQAIRTVYDEESEYELIEYLKSLVERKEQKPAWSEEDERIYQSIMDDTVQENQLDDKQTDWLRNRVKSLRPQKQWKPSDEQMKVLDIAIKCGIQLGTWEEEALKDLIEQLKKL